MNILFVSEYFWPRAAGGEVWSWELCTGLADAGHNVTVLTTQHADAPTEQEESGVRILRAVPAGKNLFSRKRAAKKLTKIVEQYCTDHDVDLIHVVAYALNVHVSRIAAIKGIPCVTSVHSFFGKSWYRLSWYGFIMRYVEKRYLKKDTSRVMHVPSAYLQEKILKETGRETVVVHNWLPEKFPKPKKLTNTFLFVGALENVKNPLACLGVAKGRHLVVIGSGRLEQRLMNEAKEQKIKLTIITESTREETLAYIGGASLVLVPSIEESFSMVALEAIGQGTPVSGSPVGILPELPGTTVFPDTEGIAKITKQTVENVRKQYSKKRALKDLLSLYKHAKQASVLT